MVVFDITRSLLWDLCPNPTRTLPAAEMVSMTPFNMTSIIYTTIAVGNSEDDCSVLSPLNSNPFYTTWRITTR